MYNVQRIPIVVLLVFALLTVACRPIQAPTPVPAEYDKTLTEVDPPVGRTSTPAPTQDPGAKLRAITADMLLKKGIKAHEAGDFDTAVTSFTDAIQFNPELAEAYVARAAAYLRLGELEAAIADGDEAIRLNPDLADAYLYRGIAHAYGEEFDAAVVDLTDAIRLNPQSVPAHVYRGATFFFLEHYAATARDCTDAIHLSGGYFLPAELCLNIMGELAYPDVEHVEAAIQDYDEAIRLDPNFAAGYLFRGLAYLTHGDTEIAVQDLEEALRLNPSLGDILFFLLAPYVWNTVDVDIVIEKLETALALVEPDSPLAVIIDGALESFRSGH